MIELGRSEEVILEMDRLASENHSHIATQEELKSIVEIGGSDRMW